MKHYLSSDLQIAVIGLGYVGLPLAVTLIRSYPVVGYDISRCRVSELQAGIDRTNELTKEELVNLAQVKLTSDPDDIEAANCYIITVPTPIDAYKTPDLTPLKNATETVSKYLKKGDIIIYESTVYPGCTEEICVPILEEGSKLKFNVDFFCGYSPERINPGDKEHRLSDIVKVTSGSTPEIAEIIDELYNSIIFAGTHKASSIKVAEAAKVIENIQRDINIALMNELSVIFNALDIDTNEVLDAAGSKWNFLNFRPGLVGGHCIGVDPYYLTHKCNEINYNPEVILSGRRINESMASYVSNKLIKEMAKRGIPIANSKVLILGVTFKENCPDLRNSKILEVINELVEFNCQVEVYDPWVDPNLVSNISMISKIEYQHYDGIILAVAHDEFKRLDFNELVEYGKINSVIYDLKNIFPGKKVTLRM